MKKIFLTLVAFALVSVCSFDADANNPLKNKKDVVITYEDITRDAALTKFEDAHWVVQKDILNDLVESAEKAYLDCKTIEDLYDVKDKIEIIKVYNRKADRRAQGAISVVHDLKVLERKIMQTEAEYKKVKVISTPNNNIDYQSQDISGN